MKRALPLSLSLSSSLYLSVSVSLSNGDSKWQLSSADGVAQKFVWLSADCAATSTLRESNKNWTKRNWNWNQSCLECCGMWNTRCCVRFPVVLATRSSLCRSKRATERESDRVRERCIVLFHFHSFRWHWKVVLPAANYGSACAISLSHSTWLKTKRGVFSPIQVHTVQRRCIAVSVCCMA